MSASQLKQSVYRLHLNVQGVVQGVGFRPFVYGLATELGLTGWVNNTAQGVTIEIEGVIANLETFIQRLNQSKPAHAEIHHLTTQWLSPVDFSTFEIRTSESHHQPPTAVILPDLATCPECLRDLFDPCDRRYHYPFINCTHCGPRFSILQDLPYDRPNTTMGQFQMCPACQAEYNDPLNRRFHAQPNACPHCGPHLELWGRDGRVSTNDQLDDHVSLQMAAAAIRQGKIVAVKGLGGFHLVADARNETAVQALRKRKRRPDKPLAIMVPSLDMVREYCQVSELEARLLCSSEAPIVLLQRLAQRQAPSSDHQTSSSEPQVSSSDRQPSSSEHQISSSELQTSSSDRQVSSSDRQVSSSDRQTSSSDRQTSSSEHQVSSSEHQVSSSDRQTSSSDRQTSSFASESLTFGNEALLPTIHQTLTVEAQRRSDEEAISCDRPNSPRLADVEPSHRYTSFSDPQSPTSDPHSSSSALRLPPSALRPPPSAPPLAPSIAPNNPYLGVMLPYTPLHHLLLAELGCPIVATSGNLSSEPICIDEYDALHRLGTLADVFLIHDRPIARPVDDSVVQVVQDQPFVLRRARGYAPLPLSLPLQSDIQHKTPTILALGAHLKSAIALSLDQRVVVSQHLGDLDTPETTARFRDAVAQLLGLYDCQPVAIACDAHPDYYSTQFAHALGESMQASAIPVIPIQHHYAHVLSCMVDNSLQPPVLGIAWDGTGYGLDGTIWGGEFLAIPDRPTCQEGFERLAHLRPFRLPGGDAAVKEPRRSALGLLYECFGDAVVEWDDLAPIQAFSKQELKVLTQMLRNGVNTPATSSAGRLFDAIASLLNLCQRASFEGHAAMQLEFALHGVTTEATYPYTLDSTPHEPLVFDWQPMVIALVDELRDRRSPALISATFHNTLVDGMVAIARTVHIRQVVLTGGCFQNRYLLKHAVHRLSAAGFSPVFHRRIPSNDGGIAVGQLLGTLRKLDVASGGS
ncbi:MAG: carbamoyltransferase HypF [Elainellaceae cyanobacterium]